MKFKIFFSLFFVIITTITVVHEVEHILHDDSSSCLICYTNNNLTSFDIIDIYKNIKIIHFENIIQIVYTPTLYDKQQTNQNRAPPLTS